MPGHAGQINELQKTIAANNIGNQDIQSFVFPIKPRTTRIKIFQAILDSLEAANFSSRL